MSYFVYLIVTIKNNKVFSYVGYTNNLKKRLSLHNSAKELNLREDLIGK